MVEWPAEDGALYTLVLSNLDINTRENRSHFKSCTQVTTFLGRTLAEFWHWFVANIPGDSVEDGEVTFATTTFPQDVSSLGHFRSSLPTYSSRG